MTVDLMQSAVTVVFVSVWAIVGQIVFREARERRRSRSGAAEHLPLA